MAANRAMARLKEFQLRETRAWRSAYRCFAIVPENIKQHEQREREMIQHIDFLLALIDERKQKTNGK